MDMITELMSTWFSTSVNGTWHWFNALSREEWMVVLAVGAAGGFLCLRGMGIKK